MSKNKKVLFWNFFVLNFHEAKVSFNPKNKAGLVEGSFFWKGWDGGQLHHLPTPLSYFKKN